jgi:hypothetical protein
MRGLRLLSLAAAALVLGACARLGFRSPGEVSADATADRAPGGRDAPGDLVAERGAGDAPRDRALTDGGRDQATQDAPRKDATLKQDKKLVADLKLVLDLKPADLKPKPDTKPLADLLPLPADSGTLGALASLPPAASPPSARRSTSAAVLSQSGLDTIWIFGGFAGVASLKNDLHSYSTTAGAWTLASVAGSPPSARERHTLAWDPAGGRLMLFGGQYGLITFTHLDELHVFSPGSGTWTAIAKNGSWPAPRKDTALAWIPHLGKHLLYGGNKGSAAADRFSDLWLLSLSGNSATWTQLAPTGSAPAQSGGCVVYDPAGHRLIVFGGETQDGVNAITTYQYLLDSNAWQLDPVTGSSVPSTGSFTQCAWHPGLGRVLLYGGQGSSGAPVAGAFLYDPATRKWSALALKSASNPGPRADGGAVFSPALGGLFWFGGRTGTISYTNESWLLKVQ